MLTYRLPDFLDYLSAHYQHLYQLYAGRLTELFPAVSSEESLVIADDEETNEEQDNYLLQLWRKWYKRN